MRRPLFIGGAGAPAGMDAIAVTELAADTAGAAGLLVLDGTHPAACWSTLRRIRAHPWASVYLKPVALLGPAPVGGEILGRAVDLQLSRAPDGAELTRALDEAEPVNRWIESLSSDYRGPDTDLSFKVLRHVASRDRELEPVATTASPFGYVYPPIEPFLEQRGGADSALQLLDFLEAEHLVSSRFVTKAHFCNQCGSAFLNFKEVCPDCAAESLECEEMLHHFRCGFTGEHREYLRGGTLVCPKCERELRHVGVDYDKPSTMYRCHACNLRFQAPAVTSTCYHCGRSANPEDQLLRAIRAYSVTAIGANAALYGLENLLTRILDADLNVWPYEAFKLFVSVEAARIARYGNTTSSLAVLHLEGLDSIYARMGRRTSELWSEISAVFQRVLRQSDVIAARNESVFVLVLTETSPGRAETALERIRADLTQLLEHNLGETPAVDAEIRPIEAGIDVDAAVEALV